MSHEVYSENEVKIENLECRIQQVHSGILSIEALGRKHGDDYSDIVSDLEVVLRELDSELVELTCIPLPQGFGPPRYRKLFSKNQGGV